MNQAGVTIVTKPLAELFNINETSIIDDKIYPHPFHKIIKQAINRKKH